MSGEISGGESYDLSWYEVNGLEEPDVVDYDATESTPGVSPPGYGLSEYQDAASYQFDYDNGQVQTRNPYNFSS
ncbi:MAG: hypothetical protein Q4F02_02090 [Candidatus Saccharibacteria bacterium]|nr:hypothetical protein [Candidatus Saccharibacteria bacterium]